MMTAINLAAIDGNSLLLVRKRNFWILPGGKPEKGESHLETLIREFGEELPGTDIFVMGYYNSFVDITTLSRKDLRAEVYIGYVEGVSKPASEINDVKYISDFNDYNLSDITIKIVHSLKKDGYFHK